MAAQANLMVKIPGLSSADVEFLQKHEAVLRRAVENVVNQVLTDIADHAHAIVRGPEFVTCP